MKLSNRNKTPSPSAIAIVETPYPLGRMPKKVDERTLQKYWFSLIVFRVSLARAYETEESSDFGSYRNPIEKANPLERWNCRPGRLGFFVEAKASGSSRVGVDSLPVVGFRDDRRDLLALHVVKYLADKLGTGYSFFFLVSAIFTATLFPGIGFSWNYFYSDFFFLIRDIPSKNIHECWCLIIFHPCLDWSEGISVMFLVILFFNLLSSLFIDIFKKIFSASFL